MLRHNISIKFIRMYFLTLEFFRQTILRKDSYYNCVFKFSWDLFAFHGLKFFHYLAHIWSRLFQIQIKSHSPFAQRLETSLTRIGQSSSSSHDFCLKFFGFHISSRSSLYAKVRWNWHTASWKVGFILWNRGTSKA